MKLGTNTIASLKIGSTDISEVRLGSVLVWQSTVLLLDLYPAEVAYSLYKQRSAYSGNCIRVRRASDNTEQDIGFSSNVINTTALHAFCTGTTGFITKLYNQGTGGSTYDQNQATASNQPQIYFTGDIIGSDPNTNRYAWFHGVGVNNYLQTSGAISIDNCSVFSIHRRVNSGGVYAVMSGGNGATGQRRAIVSFDPGGGYKVVASGYSANLIMSLDTVLNTYLSYATFNNTANTIQGTVNGSTLFSTSVTLNTPSPTRALNIGSTVADGDGSGEYFEGNISEVIIYLSDQSANATAIKTIINNNYGVY